MFIRVFLRYVVVIFFFKQKTAYEMRISDWSSDVCSSDLKANSLFSCIVSPIPHASSNLPGRHNAANALATIAATHAAGATIAQEIGRASSRERVSQYVLISVVAVSLKKKNTNTTESSRDKTRKIYNIHR